MAMSTVERSMKHSREKLGWLTDTCQRWQSFPKKDPLTGKTKTIKFRRDLFKLIDFMGLDTDGIHDEEYINTCGLRESMPCRRIVAVQATDTKNYAAHVRDYSAGEKKQALMAWLKCGGHFEIWAWLKNSRGRWVLKRTLVRAHTDFSAFTWTVLAPEVAPELVF